MSDESQVYGEAYQDHRSMAERLREEGFVPVVVGFTLVCVAGVAGIVFAEDVSRMSVALRGAEEGATPAVMRLLSVPLVVSAVLVIATIVRERYMNYIHQHTYRALVCLSVAVYHGSVMACVIALAFFQDDLIDATRSPLTVRILLVLVSAVALLQSVMEWRTLLRMPWRRQR